MKLLESRVFWGIVLIVGGVLFLFQNLFSFEFGAIFWALAFGIAAVFFLSVFISNRAMWWALIPGFTLLGIGSLIGLSAVAEPFTNQWGGSLVLGGIALGFVAVYLADRENWWAIIPGGVMLTLAAVAGVSNFAGGFEVGGLFFLGLGLTFAVIALLPTPQGRMTWAWWPASVLIIMGVLITAAFGEFINYVWPVALILAGLVLIYRTFVTRKG